MTPVFICRSIVCFLSMPIVMKRGDKNVAEKILEDNSLFLHEYFESEKTTQPPKPILATLNRLKQTNVQMLKYQNPSKGANRRPANSPISIIPYVAESESHVIDKADDSFKSNFILVNQDVDKVNVFKPNSPMILKIWGAGTESKFPPLIEILVQRIQSMFSNYIYEDLSRPAVNVAHYAIATSNTTAKPVKTKQPVNTIAGNTKPIVNTDDRDKYEDKDSNVVDNRNDVDKLTHTSIQSIQEQLAIDQLDTESRKDRINAEPIIEPDSYFETFDSDYDMY